MGTIFLCFHCGAELKPQPKEVKNVLQDGLCWDCRKEQQERLREWERMEQEREGTTTPRLIEIEFKQMPL